MLRADQITFDRNTGVAAAKGNVVLLTPDGQVMFADYAELTQGMKDGVLTDMRAILAAERPAGRQRRAPHRGRDQRIVARGLLDLQSLRKEPDAPPLWQLRARTAVQDVEHKKIEYRDAVMEMYGSPVAFIPYFWHVDPSVKRASGLLIPSIGHIVPYRRVRRTAVLLGDRRPVGCHHHADDDIPRRPEPRIRLSPSLQRRLPDAECLGRLRV